jgi:hypothetical protein
MGAPVRHTALQPGFTDRNTLADDGFGSVRHPCGGGPGKKLQELPVEFGRAGWSKMPARSHSKMCSSAWGAIEGGYNVS